MKEKSFLASRAIQRRRLGRSRPGEAAIFRFTGEAAIFRFKEYPYFNAPPEAKAVPKVDFRK
jgi:hypothetical protein